jgi:FkbM family methyltransferase
MLIKDLARRLLPPRIWTGLRLWKLRRGLASFPARRVRHTYGGVPLEIQLIDGLGAGWYDRDWPELPEIALLKRYRLKPGARVFDLGAHQGVVALMLANVVGPEGQVVAVEASPHNVRVAEINRELNRATWLHVVHAAVADKSGIVVFNEGLNGQVDDGCGGWGKVEVPARTVDDMAREFGPPDILFIDVEGFECQALRGAEQTLGARPDCFVETHVGAGLERFGGSVAEVLSFFPPEDYDLSLASQDVDDGRFRAFHPDSSLLKGRFFLVATRRRET